MGTCVPSPALSFVSIYSMYNIYYKLLTFLHGLSLNYLYYRCICGLLADKLVVLVTHQLQYAQHADSILVLKKVCSIP